MTLVCNNTMNNKQRQLLNSILNKKSIPRTTIIKGVKFVGQPIDRQLSNKYYFSAVVTYYNRAFINEELVHSLEYKRPKKKQVVPYCLKTKKF